jgi:trimeric autotransporter adhesin
VTAPLTVVASVRCLAGKAAVVVKTTNVGDAAVDVVLSSDFGAKAITDLEPGATSSSVFTTRLGAIPAGKVLASVSGSSREAAYPAVTCG